MKSIFLTSLSFLMNARLLCVGGALLLLPVFLFSQKEPMKFGKVPPEDLALAVYALDTSDAAVVLGDYGELKFQFRENNIQYYFHRHKRVKIFKRAGFDQGDIEIPFYSKNKYEEVRNIKAMVLAPDGTATDVSKREIFDEKVTENWSRKRFTIPNLSEGCIIDLQYDTYCKSIQYLPTWTFQEDIPVRWSELRLEIPEWYDYAFITQGRKPDISDKTYTTASFYLPGGTEASGNFNAKVAKLRWVMKDVPALKEEPFITTLEDYYARMRFQLNSYQYPNSPLKTVKSTWSEVAKEMYEHEQFGGQLKRKRNYDDAWQALLPHLSGAATPEDKCRVVYDFVCENMNTEPGGGYFVRKSLNECFKTKKGMSHEINLLLVALLREAGIEAYPVLVSNRDHGKMFPLYPFMDQFNNALAMTVLDGESTLLDASGPPKPMGFPSDMALNGMGWAVMEHYPQWIEISPPTSSDTYLLSFTLDEAGTLGGSITIANAGYTAFGEREKLKTAPSGEYAKKRIAKRFPDATVASETIEGKGTHDKNLKMTVSCQLPNMVQATGDFVYLSPAVMSVFDKNPFKLENRTYPVDIPYPLTERIILNLTLPEGYVVEELPEPLRMALPDDGCKFHFQLSHNANTLQMTSTLQINKLRFDPDEYDSLRNFFGMVEQKMGEQVVLKRG